MTTPLTIHGHFYQPPRENPWTEYIDGEPSAAPFPDWNTRILAECYRPNAFARIVDAYGRVERIVNNYRNISYNFGPTLLSWMELHDPATYRRILEADRSSAARHGGHGNAIAQAYNHAILPLCNERDRVTQVRWGVADFRHRFGREPEAMWLPETACNDNVLGTLIDEGLRFTILSPYQAERVRPLGAGDDAWQSVPDGSIETGRAYRYFHRDGSGRSLALFFYDGAIARSIAFEGGLASSQAFAERFRQASRGADVLVHTATDGESYGHHTKFGDRTLAHALEMEAERHGLRVINYGEFLEHHPPGWEVQLKPGPNGEGTAWSCAHGVGRWYWNCGCHTGGQEGWQQAWRTPLRESLDMLREFGITVFQEQGGELLLDPWAARDAYAALVLDRTRDKAEFLRPLARKALDREEQERALMLLEMQRQAMLMYTSCGWFFNDISGIETVQVLKYAGRLMDDLLDLGVTPPRPSFLESLSRAESNIPEMGNGADVYRHLVDRTRVTPRSVAAHLAISSLVDGEREGEETAGYQVRVEERRREQRDRLTLATCRILLENVATGRQHDYALAAMHFGGIDFYCVLRPFPGLPRMRSAARRLWADFASVSLPVILRTVAKEFGPEEYGLQHVLPGARRRIAGIVFGNLVHRFSDHYAQLYDDNRHTFEMLQQAGLELPWELRRAAEYTMSARFEEAIRGQHESQDPAAYQRALEIAEEAARLGYKLEMAGVGRLFDGMLAGAIEAAVNEDRDEHWQTALTLMNLAKRLGLKAGNERAQEILYVGLVENGVKPTPAVRELGLALGLSPRVLAIEPPAAQTA
jgi:alpha-amylase/alpha-mannosidase (GH57 family)